MKAAYLKTIIIASLMLNISLTHAAFLSFTGAESDFETSVEIGETVFLSFGVYDLASNEDLGGYDIDLGISGSSALFDFAVSRAPTSFGISIITDDIDTLNLFGLSFLFDLSGQEDGFLLGALAFTASSLGITTIDVISAELSDAFGFLIDSTNYRATINVVQNQVPQVSAPSAIGVLMILIFALLARQRHALKQC